MTRILTGLKPTSDQLHLGNYFGAVKPLFKLVDQYKDGQVFFMIATMHALTTLHDKELLTKNVRNVAKMYLAMMRSAGLNDDALIIFNQADVRGHAQLNWVFQCITHVGFMERMHAYKDAVAKGKGKELSVGTFCYPILQAVDVIIYDAEYVPVGKDQQQHVEYARDIAGKFNTLFGETFVLPECLVDQSVATIPGIDGRKMSKSYNNYIGLLDTESEIKKKVMRIPTDALPIEASKDPDSDNVYQIYKLFLSPEEDVALRERYTSGGLSYKTVKTELAERVLEFVLPIQKEYEKISNTEIEAILQKNALLANEIADKKVNEVYKRVGFTL